MTVELKELIHRRAGYRCEYCRLPENGSDVDFEIDHVRARTHGGDSESENLALSCIYCNRFKGTNLAGVDPVTGFAEFLFNPRIHTWTDHFTWQGFVLVGVTSVGRTTIQTLRINAPIAIDLRRTLNDEGIIT